MNNDDEFEDWSHPGRRISPERTKAKGRAVLLLALAAFVVWLAWRHLLP